jgi:2-polyprenyl-3-methyl-5-hydroxy-6-metoxy-1,4-benzoquinol methylase
MGDTNTRQPDPRWGGKDRDIKAQTILKTTAHFVSIPLLQTNWLDIGCGIGGIAANIAPYVKSITGIDPEPWPEWSDFQEQYPNLQFSHESIESLSLTDNSIDIIICNQVYEHVPNPQYLIAEIYRILKPGGYCYFAGPNLLFPIEPHVFWPFVHWLPRPFAVKLLCICGSKGILDAYSTHYWKLKKWLSHFEITNAVPVIIQNSEIYGKSSWLKPFWLWRFLSYIPSSVIHAMTWLSPGFVFILRKPT